MEEKEIDAPLEVRRRRRRPDDIQAPSEENDTAYYKRNEYVQTIKHVTHEYFINNSIDSEEPWFAPLMKTLTIPTEKPESVHITLNSPGGCLYTTMQLISATKRCQNDILISVEGLCASAATIWLFLGNYKEVYIDDYTTFLFHNAFTVLFGKLNEINDHLNHSNTHATSIMTEAYKNVLSSKELEDIFKGKELYLTGKEVKARLAKSAKGLSLDRKTKEVKDKAVKDTKDKKVTRKK